MKKIINSGETNLLKRFIRFFQKSPLRVAYLLESTELWGGVKVVFRQVESLQKIGYNAVVICQQTYPNWLNSGIGFVQQDPFDIEIGRNYDVLITTGFKLTSFHNQHQSKAKLIHLCQGYEGEFKEAEPILKEIEASYNLQIPRFVITDKLLNLMKSDFNMKDVFNIGQGLEHQHFFTRNLKINKNYSEDINLFLFGPYGSDVKQIETGLMAFQIASQRIPNLKLIRVSLFNTRKEEENIIGPIHEYHTNIRPEKVGELFRTKSGLLLAPSKEGEGFGLPPLEAMACGIPTVLTKISSFCNFNPVVDYAKFVEVGNAQDMAKGIIEIINNKQLRHYIVKRGIEVVQNYSYRKVAMNIDTAISKMID